MGLGAEFLSTDDVTVRSHGGTGKPANLFFMGKDSDGNGRIFINRASGNSYVTPFHMGADGTFLRDPEGRTAFQADGDNTVLRNPNDGVVFRGNSTITALQNPSGQEVFQANYLATSVCSPSGNTYINVTDSEIQFVINGAIVAYVDYSGIH